jgi:hypothetical protein
MNEKLYTQKNIFFPKVPISRKDRILDWRCTIQYGFGVKISTSLCDANGSAIKCMHYFWHEKLGS